MRGRDLAWFALACVQAVALAAAVIIGGPDRFSSRQLSAADQIRLRELHEGGVFMDGDTVYRVCVNGYEHRYYADGSWLWFPGRNCWR